MSTEPNVAGIMERVSHAWTMKKSIQGPSENWHSVLKDYQSI